MRFRVYRRLHRRAINIGVDFVSRDDARAVALAFSRATGNRHTVRRLPTTRRHPHQQPAQLRLI